MKKYIYIVVILVVVTTVVGLRSKSEEGKQIKIGSIAALTGVGSAIGQEELKGVRMAIDEANAEGGIGGNSIELVSEDVSIDKMKTITNVARKLISIDKVVAIVGPQWDEPTQPLLPLIEEAQVPTVGADNSDQLEKDKDFKYFFSTWYDNRVGVRELLRFVQKKGWTKVAIIRPVNSGFYKFTADTLVSEAPKYGVTIVTDLDMGNPLSLEYQTPIAKVKLTKADAVFIVTSDYNQCTFLKQAKELGLTIPKIGTESAGDYVSLSNCSKFLENTYFSSPKISEKGNQFIKNFAVKYGDVPKFPSAVTAYDAAKIIIESLRQTNGRGGEELQNILAKAQMEGSSLEHISFNEKGFAHTPEDTFEMMSVRGGKFVKAGY